jgi:hypothetical protein
VIVKVKRPGAALDYRVDWAGPEEEGGPWLEPGETVQNSVWSATPDGLVLGSQAAGPTATTVRLSGGADGTNYLVVNKVTTSSGQVNEYVFQLSVRS